MASAAAPAAPGRQVAHRSGPHEEHEGTHRQEERGDPDFRSVRAFAELAQLVEGERAARHHDSQEGGAHDPGASPCRSDGEQRQVAGRVL